MKGCYAVYCGIEHDGCPDDWNNMDETRVVVICATEELAKQYIKENYPDLQYNGYEGRWEHVITREDIDNDAYTYCYPGDCYVAYIILFSFIDS